MESMTKKARACECALMCTVLLYGFAGLAKILKQITCSFALLAMGRTKRSDTDEPKRSRDPCLESLRSLFGLHCTNSSIPRIHNP